MVVSVIISLQSRLTFLLESLLTRSACSRRHRASLATQRRFGCSNHSETSFKSTLVYTCRRHSHFFVDVIQHNNFISAGPDLIFCVFQPKHEVASALIYPTLFVNRLIILFVKPNQKDIQNLPQARANRKSFHPGKNAKYFRLLCISKHFRLYSSFRMSNSEGQCWIKFSSWFN